MPIAGRVQSEIDDQIVLADHEIGKYRPGFAKLTHRIRIGQRIDVDDHQLVNSAIPQGETQDSPYAAGCSPDR